MHGTDVVSTNANSRFRFWNRMARFLLFLLVMRENLKSALAFRSIHQAVFAGSSPLLLDRCQVADCRRRSRGMRTQLFVNFDEDDYSRLIRRMDHLERVVSEQNTELDVMRSSVDEMRTIIQIQAEIDSLLVGDGEEGLLAARKEFGTEGEPNPRLVKQVVTLLRMRQHVLQAWEYEDADVEMDPPDEDDLTGETLASEFSAMRGLRGLSRSSPQDRSSRLRTEEELRRDGRLKDSEDLTYSMFDDPLDTSTKGALGGGEGREEGVGYGFSSRLAKRPPKTNQDAADAAGASVVAALMEGRRRLIVEVDDAQLRLNSPDFCHEAMAEFVELLVLPLTTALENLNAEQNRCKIVIQGAHHVAQAKQAMVLDAPDSLQVVSLEDAKVAKKDRVVALVSPENWAGKKGEHLKRVLMEAHDAAIILINPTDADKFLQPADFNSYEFVYYLRPTRVNYLQPIPPLQQPPTQSRVVGEEDILDEARQASEALLLESLGDSMEAGEEALAAATAAREFLSDTGNADSSAEMDTPEDEIGVRARERDLARAVVELGDDVVIDKDWGEMDIGYRDRGWDEREDERQLKEALSAWELEQQAEGMGDVKGERWGEVEVGVYGADEAAEMSALAVTLRQYPEAWEAFVDLHDGMGFRLCGTWDLEPPRRAVKTVVMDHILRIVMD